MNDMNHQKWSSNLIQQTKQVLNDLPISAFLRDGHCIVKSMNHQFGKISIHDAISYDHKIMDIDTNELLIVFDTLESFFSTMKRANEFNVFQNQTLSNSKS